MIGFIFRWEVSIWSIAQDILILFAIWMWFAHLAKRVKTLEYKQEFHARRVDALESVSKKLADHMGQLAEMFEKISDKMK